MPIYLQSLLRSLYARLQAVTSLGFGRSGGRRVPSVDDNVALHVGAHFPYIYVSHDERNTVITSIKASLDELYSDVLIVASFYPTTHRRTRLP
jgi:hypothetical protein